MSVVVFGNQGEMDMRAVRSFGVSAKDTKSPIGYFGTGLKYAISILLRTGHSIRITSGEKEYKFGILRDNMRGKEFDFVTMNGEEMPFTTELGKNWEVPQAFRELYCNAIDEGGDVALESRPAAPRAGVTRVEVIGALAEACYYDRDKIVLKIPDSYLIHDEHVRIFDRPSKNIYYRGIAAGSLREPSDFTFNITDQMTLTEDRTLKHDWLAEQSIVRAIIKMKDRVTIRRLICAPKGTFESQMNFLNASPYTREASAEFIEVGSNEWANANKRMNSTAKDLLKHLKPKSDHPEEYTPVALNNVEQQMFERACWAVKQYFTDFDETTVTVVKELGEGIHGFAEITTKRIILARTAFPLGAKYLASTLIEEYIHVSTGKRDCTRELQTHLFDLVTSMIEQFVILKPI